MWRINYFHILRYFIVSYIYTRMFAGSRCPDYDEDCTSCKAWGEHDEYHEYHKSMLKITESNHE